MAVTRVIQRIENLIGVPSARYNVNGSESARILLEVSAIEGYMDIGLYATSNAEAATTDPRPNSWLNGVKLESNARISKVGIHEVWIDLKNIKSIYIYISRGALTSYTGTCSFATFADPINLSDIVKDGPEAVRNGGWYKDFDIRDEKQLDFSFKMLSEVSSSARKYLRLKGIKKGDDTNTWLNVLYLEKDTGTFAVDGWRDLTKFPVINGFASISDYKKIRLHADLAGADLFEIDYQFQNEFVDGREMFFNYGLGEYGYAVNVGHFLAGYKAFKVDLTSTKIENGNALLTVVAKNDDIDNPSELLNTNFERINTPYFTQSDKAIRLRGNITGGGIAFKLEQKAKGTGTYLLATSSSETGTITRDVKMKVTAYLEAPKPKSLPIFSERDDYTMFESPVKELKDAYNGDFLEYTANSITYYMYGMYGVKYAIPFDNVAVPSLLEGEQIKFAYLQPFGSRTGSIGHEFAENRIIVFTNKARVLHNYPNRLVNGVAKSNVTDMNLFDESTVLNPYKKWIPTNEKSKVSAVSKYFPVLKEYNYSQFDGRVSGSTGFIDHFGNGGLKQGTTEGSLLIDFYTPGSGYGKLSFANIARDGKMTFFGNYNGAIGEEPFVMGTSDGGRTWKVVQYFALIDMYNNNIQGGNIDLSPISSVTPYVENSLRFYRKEFNHPTKENKEPNVPFVIPEAVGEVKRFYEENGTTMVELSTPVHFGGVTPVVFFKKNPTASNIGDWEYICNEGMTADGANNNGVFFRLIRVNNTTYKMYADYGDAYQSDWICRHVHAVNKIPNGFVVSTGETYTGSDKIMSGGLLYLILQNLQDGGGAVSIDTVKKENVYRLTSTGDGVNRACGAYIFNDGENDPTMIFVGDEGANPKYEWNITGRTKGIPIAPYGIFMIKLKDIDDISKAKCIREHDRTIVSLFEHMGHFAADGHVSELMLSKDGKTWTIEALINGLSIKGVDNKGNMYTTDKLIKFK